VQGISLGGATPYDSDAPTYFPSSTIETAAEVTIAAGGEVGNVDIRYRENRGHSIGGTISVGDGPTPQVISVLLTRASGIVEATTVVMSGRNHFGFDSLLDGDYLITAVGSSGNPAMAASAEGISASASATRRITVKGADVSGINLTIEPLASITGRAVFEPLQDAKQKPACKDIRPVAIEGTVLSAPDEARDQLVDPMNGPLGGFDEATPNAKGEFTIGVLRPGTHRMEIQLPAAHLYVKTISLPQTGPNAKPIDAAKNGVRLKSGDRVKGLVVTIGEGAARMSGKIVVDADNKTPEIKMRVHLVPAEPDSGDEVLRYFEAEVGADGSFALANLAPGKYWIIGREDTTADPMPAAWDSGARTALRFEGEATRKVIELTQCQSLGEYQLKYVPLTKPSKLPAKSPR
jgi:hypothetical protein